MKVLQIHNRYRETGGEDTVVATEAAQLGEAGHEVHQHLVDNPDAPLESARALLLSPWNPASRRSVRHLAEVVAPDVAHVHNTWFRLTPSVVAGLRDAGVPVIMTLHNYRTVCANGMLFRDGGPCQDCVSSHPWHGVVHRCYRGSALSSAAVAANIQASRTGRSWFDDVDLLLVLSPFAKEVFVRGGLPEERILVKSNTSTDLGSRPSVPSSSNIVLFVGRLSEEKGVGTLLQAWRDAAVRGLELHIVGDGPLRATLEADALDGVVFHGRLGAAAVHEAMRSARALVFPSLCYEGQPMTLLEAYSAGLPVVVSDLGAPGEEVRRIQGGCVVTPGDVPAWAAALRDLVVRSDLDVIGAANRRHYERHYTPRAGLAALESAYAAVQAS
jgi:glycosyltransferase involved in cell wall biosynthesis